MCESICRKDTGRLIESTILLALTSGLKVVATSPLHIYKDNEGNILCKFGETCPTTQHSPTTIPHVDLYIPAPPSCKVCWMVVSDCPNALLISPVICQNSPLYKSCDEDLMGQVPRLWNCLQAAAMESQPRYRD